MCPSALRSGSDTERLSSAASVIAASIAAVPVGGHRCSDRGPHARDEQCRVLRPPPVLDARWRLLPHTRRGRSWLLLGPRLGIATACITSPTLTAFPLSTPSTAALAVPASAAFGALLTTASTPSATALALTTLLAHNSRWRVLQFARRHQL